MRERKGRRLGLVLIAAAVAGAFALVAQHAFAAGPTASLGSAHAAPGASASVELESIDIESPGLGAWSIDITYDPDVVTPTGCDTEHGAVCNLEYRDDMIRTAGATAVGIEGDTLLATLTFECADAEGESDLTVSLPDFADATLGGPVQINPEVVHGKITCSTTPPTAVPGIVASGTGTGASNGSDFTLLIAALAAAGVAAVAGFGVLRARADRN